MELAATLKNQTIAQERKIGERVERERGRLLSYIKKQVDNVDDAEDILQDVFFQFAESSFLLKPIEQVTAWLYTVARNRITDLFRKKKNIAESDLKGAQEEDAEFSAFFSTLLVSENDIEFDYSRQVILEELERALEELPIEQRQAFEQHELDGISFKEMAENSGETINTLISRKRYAVLHLRKRLQAIYKEFLTD